MSHPQQIGSLVVSKFKLAVGKIMGDDDIEEMRVTPDRKMARVQPRSGRVRWFLRDHSGEVYEVRTV